MKKHTYTTADGMNELRDIVRDAMNEVKVKTWSADKTVVKNAEWTWDQLSMIFRGLGNFE